MPHQCVDLCRGQGGRPALYRCLADQMRTYYVAVNCIAPGDTRTERFVATRVFDTERLATEATLDRIATVDEVVRVVEFLAGPMCDFVLGQVIRRWRRPDLAG